MEVISKEELAELVWENYYTLATTAIEALRIIWSEYESIEYWAFLEHDISEHELLETILLIVMNVVSMSAEDRQKPAMDYLSANKSR